jgi:hypothetical protein
MAKRGGPPDIKQQIGSFLNSAWQQLEGVREAVTQRTKAGRMQIDVALLKRKRKDALAALGEVVARLARSGRIDEEDFPELSGPLATLESVDDKIEREERRAKNVAAGLPDDGYAENDDGEGDREEYDEDDGEGGRAEFDEDSSTRVRAADDGDDDDGEESGDVDDAFDDDDDEDDYADLADEDDDAAADAPLEDAPPPARPKRR